MDLRQLRYFLTIAEEGQITRAAKKLNMSQPPLSQQLQMLEAELGTALFERNTRRLDLTEAGKALYKKGALLINQVEEIKTEIIEIGKGMRGTLSIGTVKTGLQITTSMIAKFKSLYPDVTYKIWEGDTSSLTSHIKNRDIDAAVVRLPLDDPELDVLSLPSESYVLVVPETWEMKENSIPMERIRDLPLLLLHRRTGRGVYEMILNECRQHGFEPNVICDCPDPSILISLVSEGLGATLLPMSTVSAFPLTTIRSIKLENCTIQSVPAIAWLKDRSLSRTAHEFIHLFR
ncbi:LysR family transcriptional regulator [Paenibacillus tyrfis]|uniref:LysR family transcriptional regulator n=1 Tax=Paenibacillus tyrfis TaxID=1501230 RepID=UPI00209EDA76|nr:LysR family transcriptional regulator [Paenibacillus tyrfis]MCP1311593.1 LysR family transcriptional regulator [Paenibacillus tyrfis]